MTEERAEHPQEPAEGDEENVPTPGAEKSGKREESGGSGAEQSSSQPPQEPAEGGEDQVEERGTEGSG